jgi:hypothetical protein
MLCLLLAAIGVLGGANAEALHRQELGAAGVALVTVFDTRNQPTVDVDASDFAVSQGNETLEVIDVRVADYPVVLLLDNGSGTDDFDAVRAAATRFIERVGDRAIAVVTLTDPPAVLASFDDGRSTAIERIGELEAAPASRRVPLQALGAASEMIREGGGQFAAIVLVSAALQEELVEPPGFLTSFLESRAILHVVLKGASASEPSRSENILRNMANRSGGRHLRIYSAASFQIAMDQIADRLGTEMLIEYFIPAAAGSDQDIRVGVKVPGARVRGLGVSR